MTKRFNETFEVRLRRQSTWQVERAGLTAPQARELGESEFRRNGVEGMQIVRCRASVVTGSVTEDLMVERIRSKPEPDMVLGTLDEAPACRTIDDLLRPGSRLALHRLFQGWLRSHEAGVTECLVSEKLLRRLFDNSTLIRNAVHHAAGRQAADATGAAAARDHLFGLADDLLRRSQDLEDWVIQRVQGDPERLLHEVEEPGGDDPWRSCATVGAYLTGRPTRLAKVEALMALAGNNDNPQALDRIDLFLSDYLMDEEIALELAGQAGFLTDRLLWLASAAIGAPPKRSRRTASARRHAFAAALPGLIGAGKLPRSSFALLLAIEAVLRRDEPLNDGSQAREQRAVLDLVQLLGSGIAFVGGPRLAARLTRRYAASTTTDGADSFVEAADSIVLGLPDIHLQARFLLALTNGPNDTRVAEGLLAIANRVFTLYGGLRRLRRRAPTAKALIAGTDVLCMLLEQAYVDEETRAAWTGKVLANLDQDVQARVEKGELTLHQLLALAEEAPAPSKPVQAALVRRLSREAGIVC